MKKTTNGFTIVELLIVIVVIAILAAISVVAYTGMQNRANNSVIQSDLANFAKQIQLLHAQEGVYPGGGVSRASSGSGTSGSSALPPQGVTFKPTKGSYLNSGFNLSYCTGPIEGSSNPMFRLVSRSSSGRTYSWSSVSGMEDFGSDQINEQGVATTCRGIGYPHSWSYGFADGVWRSWAS